MPPQSAPARLPPVMPLNAAVCLLLPREQGSLAGPFLATTRKATPGLIGLPGGKVDPGENSVQAVLREAREETGAKLEGEGLVLLCSGISYGRRSPREDFWVSAFLWLGAVTPEEHLRAEAGLSLSWADRATLCDPRVSPFAPFNLNVFAALDRYGFELTRRALGLGAGSPTAV